MSLYFQKYYHMFAIFYAYITMHFGNFNFYRINDHLNIQ